MTTGRTERAKAGGSSTGERRHLAREAAIQMLYQWEIGRADLDDVIAGYATLEDTGTESLPADQLAFARQLVRGTVEKLPELDPMIAERAEHWRLSRMAVIDRLILRLAVYEFLHTPETPKTVVINEALELAKTFSDDEAVRFVNGVLDGIKKRLEHNGEATKA